MSLFKFGLSLGHTVHLFSFVRRRVVVSAETVFRPRVRDFWPPGAARRPKPALGYDTFGRQEPPGGLPGAKTTYFTLFSGLPRAKTMYFTCF